MATLAQLYARIILDTNRDDMGSGGESEQAKIDAVVDAINHYKAEQFWFNRASGTGGTTPATATIALPAGVYVPKVVSYEGEPLLRVPLDAIEYRTDVGPPSKWAESEGSIQLWPIPDAAYTLHFYGTADIDAPAAEGDSNIWTTEAYSLILNEAKAILYRGLLRDPEGLMLSKDARQETLTMLRRETRQRSTSGLTTDLPNMVGIYNIQTDR